MNQIKTENPRTITKHQWCVINQMWLDDARWEYTYFGLRQVLQRYTFWLERSREPYSMNLMMKSDDGCETRLQVLTFGDELSSIAKQMLAIGWNKWKIQNLEIT